MAKLCHIADQLAGARSSFTEKQWLAAYTLSQHENSVAKQLQSKAVSFLLPQYIKTSAWSDRTKRTLAPLFPGYVFVNVNAEERLHVLQTEGVVNIVSMAGKPAPLRAEEVAMLQECAKRPRAFEAHPYLRIGQRVRVIQGPFAGWEGLLTAKKNSTRLVVSLDHLLQSVSVDLDGAAVEKVH